MLKMVGAMLFGAILGFVAGGYSGSAWSIQQLEALTPSQRIGVECKIAVEAGGDDPAKWDATFGPGKGQAAMDLCKLITG